MEPTTRNLSMIFFCERKKPRDVNTNSICIETKTTIKTSNLFRQANYEKTGVFCFIFAPLSRVLDFWEPEICEGNQTDTQAQAANVTTNS